MLASACLTKSGQNTWNHVPPGALHVYSICKINTCSFLHCKVIFNSGVESLAWLCAASVKTFLDCVPTGGRHLSFHTWLPSPGLHQSFQLRLAFPWGNQWCRACPASPGCTHWLTDWNSDFSMMDLLGAQPLGSGHSLSFRTVLVLKRSTWLLNDSGQQVLKYTSGPS